MNVKHIKEFRDFFAMQRKERYCQEKWEGGGICGSTYCIGGWLTAYLQECRPSFYKEKRRVTTENGLGWYSKYAYFFLGLSEEQIQKLFIARPPVRNPTKADAVAVLDVLMETGEVNWILARERVKNPKPEAKQLSYTDWAKKNRAFFDKLREAEEGEELCQAK